MPAVATAAAASYVYNDFGDLDKGPDLARPVIDTKELPYPRRCKTGRKSESRSSDVYVPRDEAFSEIKNLSFSFKTMYSVLHAVIPSLETTIIDKELGFPYFTTIDSLFNEGVNLPQLESKGFFGNVLPRLLKVIKDTQNNILLFETPEMMDKDKFGWMRDEEFCRQTLASLNPLSIRLVMPSYGLAEDTSRTRGTMGGQDVSPNELYSQSAIYIVAAHALKPNYSVHNFCLYPI